MTLAETTVLLTGYGYQESRIPLPIQQFGRFLDTLSLVAQGSVRMAFELRSAKPGPAPAWLTRAADIRYAGSGMADNGTELFLLAPTLDGTVEDVYLPVESSYGANRSDLSWPPLIRRGDTALDLVSNAISDIVNSDYNSARLDEPLLRNIEKFRRCLNGNISSAKISSPNNPHQSVRLDKSVVDAAKRMATGIHQPVRARVIGTLDMVRMSTRTFSLALDDGSEISGVLDDGNIEEAKRLLSMRVRVLGRAVYRASGRLLRFAADSIQPTSDTSAMWTRLPEPMTQASRLSIAKRNSLRVPQTPTTGINAIIGQWPGGETDDEVAQALEMIS